MGRACRSTVASRGRPSTISPRRNFIMWRQIASFRTASTARSKTTAPSACRAAPTRAPSCGTTATPWGVRKAAILLCIRTIQISFTPAPSAVPLEAAAPCCATIIVLNKRASSRCGPKSTAAGAPEIRNTAFSGPIPSSFRRMTPTCST